MGLAAIFPSHLGIFFPIQQVDPGCRPGMIRPFRTLFFSDSVKYNNVNGSGPFLQVNGLKKIEIKMSEKFFEQCRHKICAWNGWQVMASQMSVLWQSL